MTMAPKPSSSSASAMNDAPNNDDISLERVGVGAAPEDHARERKSQRNSLHDDDHNDSFHDNTTTEEEAIIITVSIHLGKYFNNALENQHVKPCMTFSTNDVNNQIQLLLHRPPKLWSKMTFSGSKAFGKRTMISSLFQY